MLMIRMMRVGRTNDPAYRLVVTERRSAPKGKPVEYLGSYHPKTKQAVIKADRVRYWFGQGAKASDTAHNLLVKEKVISEPKRAVKMKKPIETPAA